MSDAPLLSFCIATRNRAAALRETLENITAQLCDVSAEIVVVDGNSTDDTEAVVTAAAARDQRIRYFRETSNAGFDADYDKAVTRASGKYCWLASDDDLLETG